MAYAKPFFISSVFVLLAVSLPAQRFSLPLLAEAQDVTNSPSVDFPAAPEPLQPASGKAHGIEKDSAQVIRNRARDEEITKQIFNASLSFMAIVLAVIAIVLGEYLRVKDHPVAIWKPYRNIIIGIIGVVLLAGLTSLLSLFYLWGYAIPVPFIVTLFILLIATVMVAIPGVIVYFLR